MNKKKHSELSFALRKIVTKQFAILEEVYKEDDLVSMNMNLTFSVNREERAIGSSLKVDFSIQGAPFILIEVVCFFEIKQTSWETFLGEDGKEHVPQELLSHLALHTVGTVRGVLHAKTENTIFNRFILPPVNVNDMIKEDLVL